MSEKSDWEQGYDQAQRRFYEERKVLTARIAELEAKIRHNALWQASEDAEERAHLEKLVPVLKARIAELEAENERFTVHSDIERQDDKWMPEVQDV